MSYVAYENHQKELPQVNRALSEGPELIGIIKEFEELLSKNDFILENLYSAGHRLKNTRTPEQNAKEPASPYSDDCVGKLLELLSHLRRQGNYLTEVTNKITSLI